MTCKPHAKLIGLALLFVNGCPVSLAELQTRRADVTSWGARGDGVTDDGAALQRAIDRQPPGGELSFGDHSRVYLTSRQLVLRPDVAYTGSATIRMMPGAARGTQLAVLRYSQSDNVTIEGLTLDSGGVGGGLAVNVMGHGGRPALNVTISGVTFRHTVESPKGAYDSAIYSPAGLSNSKVVGNVFEDCGSGISIANPEKLLIADNRFQRIYRGDAIFLTFSPGNEWAGHDIQILRNSGSHLGRMAIEVWARQPTSAEAVTVRGNSFADWNPDARGNGFGISMMTGQRAIVSDNTMIGRAEGLTFGIEMGAPGSVVEHNHVEGFRIGIALHSGAGTRLRENQLVRQDQAGIQITNAPGTKSGLLIENNVISNAGHFGIWTNSEGWGESQVLNNKITRTAGAFGDDDGSSFIGIATSPPTEPVTVAGNTIVFSSDRPTPGFSFAGLKINGRPGANNGSVYRDNSVQSASGGPFGVGVLLNAQGSADGLTLSGNRFEGLSAAMQGPASRGVVLRGNTVLRCASPGLLVR